MGLAGGRARQEEATPWAAPTTTAPTLSTSGGAVDTRIGSDGTNTVVNCYAWGGAAPRRGPAGG